MSDFDECPNCAGGGQASSEHFDIDEDGAYEEFRCKACGMEWSRSGSVDIEWMTMRIINEPDSKNAQEEDDGREAEVRMKKAIARRYGTDTPQSIRDYWGVAS